MKLGFPVTKCNKVCMIPGMNAVEQIRFKTTSSVLGKKELIEVLTQNESLCIYSRNDRGKDGEIISVKKLTPEQLIDTLILVQEMNDPIREYSGIFTKYLSECVEHYEDISYYRVVLEEMRKRGSANSGKKELVKS